MGKYLINVAFNTRVNKTIRTLEIA
ncbi:ABC transporter, partial [Raoultella ornithinolytica]